jgi:hypothetical protein
MSEEETMSPAQARSPIPTEMCAVRAAVGLLAADAAGPP